MQAYAHCKFLSENLYLNLYQIYIWEILKSANGCFWLFFYFSNLYFRLSLYKYEEKLWSFMVKKCLLKLDYVIQSRNFKGHVKIVEIYMVKFNVSISNRLKIMGFFVNAKYIHKHVISNQTVTKLFTILTKCFFFQIWTLQITLKQI